MCSSLLGSMYRCRDGAETYYALQSSVPLYSPQIGVHVESDALLGSSAVKPECVDCQMGVGFYLKISTVDVSAIGS